MILDHFSDPFLNIGCTTPHLHDDAQPAADDEPRDDGVLGVCLVPKKTKIKGVRKKIFKINFSLKSVSSCTGVFFVPVCLGRGSTHPYIPRLQLTQRFRHLRWRFLFLLLQLRRRRHCRLLVTSRVIILILV